MALGQTILLVQDTSLQNSQPVECVIEIVDAKKLEVKLDHSLIEQNATTLARIKVFD